MLKRTNSYTRSRGNLVWYRNPTIIGFLSLFFTTLGLQLCFFRNFQSPRSFPFPSSFGSHRDPKLVWLLSFPNSGTSYTIQLLRRSTHLMTASNYATENNDATESVWSGKDERTLPFSQYDHLFAGPFWSEARYHSNYSKPNKFILTKTHCGENCMDCGPETYAMTYEQFHQSCSAGKKVVETDTGSKTISVSYHPQVSRVVAKTIHLVRDPFNNVVSRFHHEWNQAMTRKATKEDFRKYCQIINNKHDSNIDAVMGNLSCRDDFVRYIQWHNHAFHMEQRERLPTLVIHYEDYETSFKDTHAKLLDYLDAPMIDEAPSFDAGKSYHDFYTEEERDTVYRAFRNLASPETWRHIKQYFERTATI